MLRINQNSTAAGAKSYYSTADYYTEGQELAGVWRGKAAERLGLSGEVEKGDWDALCDNRDPRTGRTLTPRQKENRRVGYDFNFHVPKSVSLLYALTEDEQVLEAFQSAVNATMEDMESEMQARVRVGRRNEDRTTGNLVWGEYVHTTARPVNGVPDPHLHAHCFVFNATWDDSEERWKAGQFAGLKRDAPYFEAVFHSRLAHNLAELGLPIVRTKKGWELVGLDAATLAKFSRRTAEIEAKAQEKGITDPDRKGELGARTRSAKAKQMSLSELQALWRDRLTPEEGDALTDLTRRIGGEQKPDDPAAAREAVSRAIGHCFERKSVVPERTLLTAALKGAYGTSTLASVSQKLASRTLLRAQLRGQTHVTTSEILAEERHMLDFAREGRGACPPLAAGEHAFKREWLGPDQRRAVEHVLGSRDRVILVRGGAGTGKTSMMQEAAEAIDAGGHKVFAFAPSAAASRGVLRTEGFAEADTVARLLLDERLQDRARGQLLWIDEAGLLSAKATAQLFTLARRLNTRVVLSGDRRQHASVERGAPLQLLEEEAGLVPAEIKGIQRQKGDYKRAVQALSEGRTAHGLRELDRLGWVREAPAGERYQMLAADYVEAAKAGESALVVSPTHIEGEWVTNEIRGQLKRLGAVGHQEHRVLALENANLTEAERRDPASYQPGDVLVFHQNAKGFKKGDRVTVGTDLPPLDQAARFQVFRPGEITIAPGDVLRVTRNGTTADGKHRLNNGALCTVKGLDRDGNLRLQNGWTISRNFGHIAYGYCTTSHASQSRTVDRVIVGQSSQSWPASSREQFYVSVSRGRNGAVIYTDDKAGLLDAVQRSDVRLTATELMRQRILATQRLQPTAAPERRRPERDREREHARG